MNTATASQVMLTKLKQAHAELLDQIAQIGALVSGERAQDDEALTGVRWRLSRASRARAKLVENEILPFLLERVSPGEREQLTALRNAIQEASALSSQHVGAWSSSSIAGDRPGYRRASLTIQQEMRVRIASEKRLLYPLLERQRS